MQKQKRGAVELSINTIVIVVIGITILTLGLKWIYDIFGGIGEQSEQLQKLSENQIMEIFGQSDAAIYTPQTVYEGDQGDTLKIDMYLRNAIQPGNTYTFKYTINLLDGPPNIQPGLVMSKLKWYNIEKQLSSGDAFRDIVLFETSKLPLGNYKFEATSLCTDPGCDMEESIIFIVEIT